MTTRARRSRLPATMLIGRKEAVRAAIAYTAANAAAAAEREWQGQRILDYAHGRIS
ncbi:MAG: hypothetical protein KatS3mg015_2528 [Fimbriimonadales bacterium]|nr:MAG: hypothetical protein KatS3mg015_2528 [Fimbriimonadales bacterium]